MTPPLTQPSALKRVAIVFSGGPAPAANRLRYVPFSKLVDPQSLSTKVRFIEPGSDFHRLAQQLGTRLPDMK